MSTSKGVSLYAQSKLLIVIDLENKPFYFSISNALLTANALG